MQMTGPGYEALDDLLMRDRDLETRVRLRFDWNRSGHFDNPDSDLSDNFKACNISRDINGVFPAEAQVVQGFSGAKLTLTLTGNTTGSVDEDGDPIPLWKLFSPFNAYFQGSIGAINTPMKLELVYVTDDGREWFIPQFTGFMLEPTVNREDMSVELVVGDATSQLTTAGNINGYAHDYGLSVQKGDNQLGMLSLSWHINNLLRKGGVYQGPVAPDGSLGYFTLTGGCYPEVGRTDLTNASVEYSTINDNVVRQLQFNRSALTSSTPGYQPLYPYSSSSGQYPYYKYAPDKFGPSLRPGSNRQEHFFCYSNTNVYTPTSSSPGQSRIYIGGWVKWQQGGPHTPYISYKQCLSNNNNGPSFTLTGFQDGGMQISYTNSSSVSAPYYYLSHVYDGDYPADGWIYLAIAIDFYGTYFTVNWKFDSREYGQVETWTDANGKATGTPPYPDPSSYANYNGRTCEFPSIEINVYGPSAHWGSWYEYRKGSNPSVPPRKYSNDDSLKKVISANIRPSYGRVGWWERVRNTPVWDTLKEMISADNSTMNIDESGIFQYRSFIDFIQLQDTTNSTAYLTLDDMKTLNPGARFQSVINSIGYTYEERFAYDQTIWSSNDINQFWLPPYGSRVVNINLDESIVGKVCGQLPVRYHTQGYRNANDGNYAPEDFMRAYPQEVWRAGYTCQGADQGPGDKNLPQKGTGYNAFIYDGYPSIGKDVHSDDDAAADPFGEHMQIEVVNSRGVAQVAGIDQERPFLRVRGSQMESTGQSVKIVSTDDLPAYGSSKASFGTKHYEKPSSTWSSDFYTQYDICLNVITQTSYPNPFFVSAAMIADPRRQLLDVVRIDDLQGLGGPMYASVLGIERNISKDEGVTESYTLRTFLTRGPSWILGDDVASNLGQTTIL